MFKKINQTAVAVVVSSLSLSTSAVLQANSSPPVIVISPSQIAQPINEVGSSVIFLQADELRQRGIEFIEDALLEVPSLIVSSQGARGSMVQARVRGNEANHVLVLIDGMRVSNAVTGEFDLSNLSLAAIENIEVLLGPQSTIYGTDAIAGVINITTRKGRNGVAGSVKLDAGDTGIRSASANINGGLKQWHYSLTVEDYATDGISSAAEKNGNTEKDAFDKQALNIKAGYDSDKFSSSIILSQSDSSLDFDGSDFNGVAVDEEVNNQQIETQNIAWLVSIPSSDNRFSNQFQLSQISNDFETVSVFFGSESRYTTDTDRNSFSYRGSAKLDDSHSLQFGLEEVDEKLATESAFGTFKEDVGYSDQYLNLLINRDALNISVGIRSTDHDEFGRHHTYRLTASYQLNNLVRFRGAHGTAYKTPSLQELFDTSFGGNVDLQPEEAVSSEIGVEYSSADYFLSLTYFDQKTTDLIRYTGSFPTGMNQNVGKADNKGLELSVKKDWQRFTLTTSLSKTTATETVNGVTSDRLRVPEWSANMLANYHYENVRVWLQSLYRDERRDIQFSFPSQDVTLDSYTLWNLGASYQLNDLTFSVRVENLTDEDYEEVFSFGTRGRTAIVSAQWLF